MADGLAALDEQRLADAVKELCRIERAFQPIVGRHGMPSLRAATGGLEGLLLIVTEQFLSLLAARAIWLRLAARLAPFEAQTILNCPQEELVSLGLSRAKAKSFHGIAEAVQNQTLVTQSFHAISDNEIFKQLIKLPGVGPWTADIYLLSCLLRPDVWPWGDVALQAAAQDLFKLKDRPGKQEMLLLGERFRPYRAVAARLLWSHYRGLKNLKQA